MAIYRPTKIRPKTKKKVMDQLPPVFDVVKELGNASEFALSLERLRTRYQTKIDELDGITDITKANVQEELKRLNDQFVKDALVKIENIVTLANKELERAKTIQKGDKGDSIKGDKGNPPSKDELVALIKPLIPSPVPGPKGDTIRGPRGDTAPVDEDSIITKLLKKLLKKELEIGKIKGLEERLRNMSSKLMLGGKGGGGQGSWKVKALLGTMNGTNTDFTYSGSLPATNSHIVELNYQPQNPLTDYTVSESNGVVTVAYTVAPHASLNGFAHIIRFM